MTSEPSNPYETPVSAIGEKSSIAWAIEPLFVLTVILCAALFVGIAWTRGSMQQIYYELGTELPLASAIALSVWTLAAVGLMTLATILKQFTLRSAAHADLWNLIVSLSVIPLAILYTILAWFPLIGTIQDLQ